MKKILFFAVFASIMLAACSSEEDAMVATSAAVDDAVEAPIMFTSSSASAVRSTHVGADAAGLLNKHFTVGGFKSNGPVTSADAAGEVFDDYKVNWLENTAATTESNTSDWEYVGVTAEAPSSIAGKTQTIKYWDYSKSQHDFIAYSTGKAVQVTGSPATGQVCVTAINSTTAGTAAYTLTGDAADLKECYIADMVTVGKAAYGKEVELTFRALASKVRVALYETIPGYSVKDVKFYTDAVTDISTGASATDATLFTTGSATKDNFFTAGTYTVSFPTIGSSNADKADYNKAHVSFSPSGIGTSTIKSFGALDYKAKESDERLPGNIWLGHTFPDASYAGEAADNYYQIAMPNEEGAVMQLRVDYTMVPTDGSNGDITVHGATAFVPAAYTKWLPNYAYTYIFKISDNTNGWTSDTPIDPAGLYPISFDAVVAETQDFTQSTVTTVATPSITTYQKGHDVTADEYDADDIYVQVMTNGTLNSDLAANSQLYTLSDAATEADVMDALNIRSATYTGSIVGRNGLTLYDASSAAGLDATITAVPGADGNDITVAAGTAAKFSPYASTTYAYVYYTGVDNPDTEYTTAVILTAEPAGWPTGYYTDEACTTAAPSTFAAGTYYQKYTNLNKVYGVKVIKIQ